MVKHLKFTVCENLILISFPAMTHIDTACNRCVEIWGAPKATRRGQLFWKPKFQWFQKEVEIELSDGGSLIGFWRNLVCLLFHPHPAGAFLLSEVGVFWADISQLRIWGFMMFMHSFVRMLLQVLSNPVHNIQYTRWWFQTFFMFTLTWGNDPIWLIFFKWVETTN